MRRPNLDKLAKDGVLLSQRFVPRRCAPLSSPEDMDSISLGPLLEGKRESNREYVLSSLNKWRMVLDGRYRIILTEGKSLAFYDLLTDPLKNENVAPRLQDRVSRLVKLIHEV